MVSSELAAACSSSDLAVVSGSCRRMCPQVGLGLQLTLSFPIVLYLCATAFHRCLCWQRLSSGFLTLFREGFRTDCSKKHCFPSLQPEQSPLTLVVWYLPILVGKQSNAVVSTSNAQVTKFQ